MFADRAWAGVSFRGWGGGEDVVAREYGEVVIIGKKQSDSKNKCYRSALVVF